ncbi:glycosyltransferase family 87 protein [Microbacterium sp. ARD31]|uniref:glycosyltransferase family 87 protein n=1 Tax=Microbacterium sp. ARD31 TaxID=2962576 RepID=UPI00288190BB|nr:glycosyltransferase family 87 protein [Microbacterium sp. ARD31]MDT0186473.1 glycosyltransferase family 87 protein [Microbacterium sp. ARD31]
MALVSQRYLAAMSQVQPDLAVYFLPAARAIARGGSPYGVEGYFYTPLLAAVLVPMEAAQWAQIAWTAAMLAAACGMAFFAVLACTPNWSWLHRAWVFAVAIVTLLWSWPITMEFFLGQVNLFVGLAIALAAFFASRGYFFSTGLGLGLAAAIKTWPVLLLLWVFRRGGRERIRTLSAVLLWGAIMIALAVSLGGVPTLVSMITSPFRGTNQDVLAYSVWGLGRALFEGVQDFPPLVVSPLAEVLVSVLSALVVAGLLALALRAPGTDVISLYNVVFAVILLIPISHQVYVLLPLPALWWWLARTAQAPREIRNWCVTSVLVGWWIVTFRLVEFGLDKQTAVLTVVGLVVATLVAAGASTIGAATVRSPQPGVEPSGAGISRTGGLA